MNVLRTLTIAIKMRFVLINLLVHSPAAVRKVLAEMAQPVRVRNSFSLFNIREGVIKRKLNAETIAEHKFT